MYHIVAFKDNINEVSAEAVYFGCKIDSPRLESKIELGMGRISSFEKINTFVEEKIHPSLNMTENAPEICTFLKKASRYFP